MKKFLWTTLAVVMCLFTACSDDDGNKIPEGPTTTFAGKLPTKVGSYTFVYDENNRCTQVKNGSYVYCEIDYDKGVIISDDEEVNVSFNSKGYITEVSSKWNYEEEGDTYKGSGKISFHYNGDGQLVSSSLSSSESGKEDGESFSYRTSGESSYTWENGNLVKTVIKEVEEDDQEKYEYGATYTIKYGDDKNELGQNTRTEVEVLELESVDVLSLIGMFGKSSRYFPVSYTDKYYEKDMEEDYENEDDYNVRYDLNEDGTIEMEYISSDSYTTSYQYLYTTVTDEEPEGRSLGDNSKMKKLSFRSFFVRHHAKK